MVSCLFRSVSAGLVEFIVGRNDVECLEYSDSLSQCEFCLWDADIHSGNRDLCAIGHYEARMKMVIHRTFRIRIFDICVGPKTVAPMARPNQAGVEFDLPILD